MKVECRDADNKTGSEFDSLGSVQFEIGALVGAKHQTLVLNLMEGSKKMGKLVVRAENRKIGDQNAPSEDALIKF